jgi:hypothetical protein
LSFGVVDGAVEDVKGGDGATLAPRFGGFFGADAVGVG